MDDTFDRLVKILLKSYKGNRSAMTPGTRLDEIGIDSLGVGLMLFDVEDEFKIKFTADPGPLPTLGAVVSHIEAVIAEQPRDAVHRGIPSAPRS
jgi:acyl carrier protein